MKLKVLFAALVFVLVIPTSAFAGAGSWDRVYTDGDSYNKAGGSGTYIRPTCTNCWDESYFVKSSGGDFGIKIDGPAWYDGRYAVKLYEYDVSNSDDYVKTIYAYDGSIAKFSSISGYLDGDNGKAEFYVKISAIDDGSTIALGDIVYYD